ncbi:MAG TPA: phage baseplate assembly protein V [Xanthobacteraceae bacterium]|nr:phage baseplate assembly protein V [Xanthobacteraceae bacterium]
MAGPLWGKYRGVVTNSVDPKKLGRVMVSIPSVTGNETAWAMPCVPFSGTRPSKREIPPVGTPVWVEFEGGDVSRPIWVGRFWVK